MAFKTISKQHVEHVEAYMRVFDLRTIPGAGYSFDCDAKGALLPTANESAWANYTRCVDGLVDVIDRGIRDCSRNVVIGEVRQCECGGYTYFSRGCGAHVCERCEAHDGMARCFCGWSLNGRHTGRQELIEMGENLDDDY